MVRITITTTGYWSYLIRSEAAPPKFVYPSCCYELLDIKYEFIMAFNSIKFILNLIKIHLAVLKLKHAEGQTDLPLAFISCTSCKECIIKNWWSSEADVALKPERQQMVCKVPEVDLLKFTTPCVVATVSSIQNSIQTCVMPISKIHLTLYCQANQKKNTTLCISDRSR
jgi:hypothetical protein